VPSAVINNSFYDQLDSAWWEADDHMISFLRAENVIRLHFVQNILQEFDKPLKILDLGSGGGLLTIPLAKAGHHVTALDMSQPSLDVLQEKASTERVVDNIETIQANLLEPWQLNHKGYDVILAMDILEHVSNPELIIQQASRFLKPGGLFFYHTLNQTFPCWLIYLQLAPRIIRNSPKHLHIYEYCIPPRKVLQWLAENNLQGKEQTGIRPKLTPRIIWTLLTQRRLSQTLDFVYTKNLTLGYMGYAQRLTGS